MSIAATPRGDQGNNLQFVLGDLSSSGSIPPTNYDMRISQYYRDINSILEEILLIGTPLSSRQADRYHEGMQAAFYTAAAIAGLKSRKGSEMLEFSHYYAVSHEVGVRYASWNQGIEGLPGGLDGLVKQMEVQLPFLDSVREDAVVAMKVAILHDCAEELIDQKIGYEEAIAKVMLEYNARLSKPDPQRERIRHNLQTLTKKPDEHTFAYQNRVLETEDRVALVVKTTDREMNIFEIDGIGIGGRISKNLAKTFYLSNGLKQYLESLLSKDIILSPSLIPLIKSYQQLTIRASNECGRIERDLRASLDGIDYETARRELSGVVDEEDARRIAESGYAKHMEKLFGAIDVGLDQYDRNGMLKRPMPSANEDVLRAGMRQFFRASYHTTRDTDKLFDGLVVRSEAYVQVKHLVPVQKENKENPVVSSIQRLQFYADAAQWRRVFQRLTDLTGPGISFFVDYKYGPRR